MRRGQVEGTTVDGEVTGRPVGRVLPRGGDVLLYCLTDATCTISMKSDGILAPSSLDV